MTTLRERVLKAIREAGEKQQDILDQLHRRGSMNPTFDVDAIVEAAEAEFDVAEPPAAGPKAIW